MKGEVIEDLQCRRLLYVVGTLADVPNSMSVYLRVSEADKSITGQPRHQKFGLNPIERHWRDTTSEDHAWSGLDRNSGLRGMTNYLMVVDVTSVDLLILVRRFAQGLGYETPLRTIARLVGRTKVDGGRSRLGYYYSQERGAACPLLAKQP